MSTDSSTRSNAKFGQRASLALLRILPKSGLSRFVGRLTRIHKPRWLVLGALRAFAKYYAIDLAECDPLERFQTFGDFFTRVLKPGLRPVAPGDHVVISPVDAVVSQIGVAEAGTLVQAKGLHYSLEALLADPAMASRFRGGAYATLYLSPRDYHRIHFPLTGQISGCRYVPGQLWPVNAASVEKVPGLFTVNERLVTFLETPLGACAVVAVGATVVGRIRASYDPSIPVSNLPQALPLSRQYPLPIPIVKGSELGVFEMGSTVILLLERGRAGFRADLAAGARVRMGEAIGGRV